MDRVYQEAFAEVDEILKMMPIDLISKIPMKFRQIISENKKPYIKYPPKQTESIILFWTILLWLGMISLQPQFLF